MQKIEISYYCLCDDENIELEIFKYFHQNRLKNEYLDYNDVEVETQLYIKSDSEIPFLENKLVHAELEAKGLKVLPIIIVNGMIRRRGGLLSPDELSAILNVGISIQIDAF
ncbi:arsenic metallochaperone ArsD family protein [Paenilisteria rocourtiae]|uniref:Arsenical resistance operon trans-acting repressor ArsD n=1 Tax=Listeria rocourtiae TaxID=647910 RepID=A0A4R6ZN49_9LIST|nr:arsenic metallochaperone ArsD family protein [Listeria rocourtiae]EUJ44956.1 hypothetical protein PROCOU_12728 [Listeria rocourtiae FSL F6-920]MBC1603962.1 arsenic metallochaperone ArsD family protein [Listeria rocourtiae]TDR53529.1 arsenical resistance operon trans-acting repressor ArsD [Listeria rocourtiae]